MSATLSVLEASLGLTVLEPTFLTPFDARIPSFALALLTLVVMVFAGLLAHEAAHALVLRSAGISFVVRLFPGRAGGVGLLAATPVAAVHPDPGPGDSAWILRVAALAPLALAAPVFLIGFAYGLPADPVFAGALMGWLACAIPSPQDFSVAFYAHRALGTRGQRGGSI